METPVALIVFNRPELTQRSFERVRRAQPERLYLIADGPRSHVPEDQDRCGEVREGVANVDWPCEVHRIYAESNLGLKRRVVSGLDEVFAREERAIVLEDDCLPHPDFFTFCEALLERYADDERVGMITGNNFQAGQQRGDASYYFSRYPHVWGWATWRRSWQEYDPEIGFWGRWCQSDAWEQAIPDKVERRYWEAIFDRVAAGKVDSWAYPWTANMWFHGRLTATPNANLVENVGFGMEATHTYQPPESARQAAEGLGQVTHPAGVTGDPAADAFAFEHHFEGWRRRGLRGLTRFLPHALKMGIRKLQAGASRRLSGRGDASE